MPANIWIDVEDLFEYARDNARPSGIQRLAFEIDQALHLQQTHPARVHFVRHAPVRNSFRTVPWSDVAGLFAGLTGRQALVARHVHREPRGRAGLVMRRLVQRLPTSLRLGLTDALLASRAAIRAWVRLFAIVPAGIGRILDRTMRRPRETPRGRADGAAMTADFATEAAPGDVLLVLGSPWFHPDYPGLIRRHREQHGLKFAMLVYDLIPLRRPEWCDRGLVRLFGAWFIPMLPLCDHLFAISDATARDVAAFAAEIGVVLPRPIVPIPIGTGLGAAPAASSAASMRALPPPGSYALIVSTIEARKNHLLLFRVWRRLLADLPGAQVPTLVFAGRIGWLVDDLMRQIDNTSHLGGKLVVLESPTDAELVALYGGCLFTLFPSFFEGWGLPVTESLAFGKPCLISNRTSLPEAGGALARLFDPDDLHDAYRAIREVIDDRAGLARWEEQVRREFRPVPWSATAAALLAGLGLPAPGSDHPVASPAEECLHQQDQAGDHRD